MNNLPFPWEDSNGIAPVLHDFRIWADFFPVGIARKAVKNAAKQSLGLEYDNHVKFKSINDDVVLGNISILLMSSQSGRTSLRRTFKKYFKNKNIWFEMAQHIYHSLMADEGDNNGFIPSLEDVCVQGSDDRWYLDIGMFREWTRKIDLPVDQTKSLALFGCAFAILQPDLGTSIYEVLTDAYPFMKEFLINNGTVDEPLHIDEENIEEQKELNEDICMEDRITELRKKADDLCDALSEAINLLNEDGNPVDEQVVDGIQAYNEMFSLVCKHLKEEAQGLDLDLSACKLDCISSLKDISENVSRTRINRIKVAERYEEVSAITSNVRKLVSSDPRVSLDVIKTSAERLANMMASTSAGGEQDLNSISEQVHSLKALLMFVNDFQKLEPQEFSRYLNELSNTFGEEVTIGIIQGKVFFRKDQDIGLENQPGSEEPGERDERSASDRNGEKYISDDEGSSPETEEELTAVTVNGATDSVDGDVISSETPAVHPEGDELLSSAEKEDTPLEEAQDLDQGAGKENGDREEHSDDGLLKVVNAPSATSTALHSSASKEDTQPVEVTRESPEPETVEQEGVEQEKSDFHESQIILLNNDTYQDNLEWSYWLAYGLGDKSYIPVWLMETFQIGLQYQPGFKRSEERLRDLFNEAAGHLDGLSREESLLLSAAVIRPSLMAPYTYPIYVLNMLSQKMDFLPQFKELSAELIRFGERGTPLAEEILSGLNYFANWESEFRRLRDETNKWIDEAPRWKVQFAAATYVWQAWVKEGGLLRNLLSACMNNTIRHDDAIKEINKWKDKNEFKQIMDETHERVYHQVKQKSIGYGALDALKRYTSEALKFAERWIEVHRRKPLDGKGAASYSREALQKIKLPAQMVVDSLNEFIGPEQPLFLRTAAKYLKDALMEVITVFSPDKTRQRVDDPIIARDRLLLLLPEIGGQKDLAIGSQVLYCAVLRHLEKPFAPEDAFLAQLKSGHIHRSISLIEQFNTEFKDGEISQQRIEEARREWRMTCEARLNKIREQIQEHHLKGVIDETKQSALMSEVEQLARFYESNIDEPDTVLAQIENIERNLTSIRLTRQDEIRAHLERIDKSLKKTGRGDLAEIKEDFDRILGSYDIAVAEEYLARIESSLENDEIDSAQRIDFSSSLNQFKEFMDRVDSLYGVANDMLTLKRRITQRDLQELPELLNLNDDQMGIVLETIRCWNEIQTGGSKYLSNVHKACLFHLLRWLGFQVEISAQLNEFAKQGGPNFWQGYEIDATIDSPIPLFGSFALSKHIIVLVWGTLEPEQLAQWLTSRVKKDKPITIIYFNRLRSSIRRSFIHTVRRSGYCPILIDACLFVWLLAQQKRTESLFAIGLTGGHYNPYMPDIAGGLPSEMFFGRGEDIENIWKIDGACIVFGGRQLGKSALLQQVIRRYHDPRNEHYVLYAGTKHTTDIWDLMRHMLETQKLLPKQGRTTHEGTKTSIQLMLERNPSRRILILLDECDQFLDDDSRKRFEQTALIRDLMTQTARRFKVVLTGLHSVQRFQRIPNHPLAHFGDPICVGPLKPQAALDLVQKPLKALGYEFATPSLAHRILAHTNYNPCLIQLFCHDLVETMLVSTRQRLDTTPPFIIDERAIAQVYNKVNLLRKMRERFDWTLGLDKRYRAIGYTFAYLELEGELTSTSREGLLVKDILKHVSGIWEEGFRDTNIDELTGLLEEMKGLGVLIVNTKKQYRLRSPNVVRLLGGQDEVIVELDRIQEEPYEPSTDPQIIRRVLDPRSGKASPFSVTQESDIISRTSGLSIIIGSRALGIEDSYDSLQALCKGRGEDIKFKKMQVGNTDASDDLIKRVKHTYNNRNYDGFRILIEVRDMEPVQLDSLLRKLVQWIDSLRTEKRFVRIVCQIKPESLVTLYDSDTIKDLDEHQGCTVHRLRRWREAGLRQWFYDIDRTPDKAETPREWMLLTGGWPVLVEDLQSKFLQDHGKNVQIETVDIASLTGLTLFPEAVKFFDLVRELGPIGTEDLYEFCETEGITTESAKKIQSFLADLDIITGPDDSLRAEPYLAEAISEKD